MRWRAIVMVPQVLEFEELDNPASVKNQALALSQNFPKVLAGEETYEAKVLGVYPVEPSIGAPLVFDPPPMAA